MGIAQRWEMLRAMHSAAACCMDYADLLYESSCAFGVWFDANDEHAYHVAVDSAWDLLWFADDLRFVKCEGGGFSWDNVRDR